jgi:hypothetical protein
MATTPNYGWVMPDPTDFVTNLPADFEIFGDAVDATVDGIETTANAAQPNVITTEGDLVVGDASGDPDRLPIGAAGTVLTSDGDTAEWAAASGATANWTLLNSGGTALTGATTITVSGISGKEKLLVLIDNASSANASSIISLRFNSDTGSNYISYGNYGEYTTTYNHQNFAGSRSPSGTSIEVARMSSVHQSAVNGGLMLEGCKGTNGKPFTLNGGAGPSTGNGQYLYNLHGIYTGTSPITSVSVISSTGNFDASGLVFIYGSDN